MKFLPHKSLILGLSVMFFFGGRVRADEVEPYFPKTSHAPLDVRKGATMPDSSVSRAEATEIKGEFGGILYMAQNPYVYEKWPAKDMADCAVQAKGSICGTCQLIMGHSNADYYFYKDPATNRCVLQQVDAHFQVSDPKILKYLKLPAQDLLGSAYRGEKPSAKDPGIGWDGSGSGWVWSSSEDLAYLYMDAEQAGYDGLGVARFQWRRNPSTKLK